MLGFFRQGDPRSIVALGIRPLGLDSRTPAVFIRLADNGVGHLILFQIQIGRTSCPPGLTISGTAGIAALRAVRIYSDVAALAPARLFFRLAAVFLQPLVAALVECFAAAQLRDGLFGLLAQFFTAPAESTGDLVAQSRVAFDGDGFHAPLDAARLEAVVPGGVDVRCWNHQAVALELRAHPQRVAALTGMLVHLEAVERQRPADAAG